jgi:hypothetical protein
MQARPPDVIQRPPEEDLYGLYVLCGGDEHQILEHLAKFFKRAPQDIAPTVRSWLADMPAIPPPSRQRSAPPKVANQGVAPGVRLMASGPFSAPKAPPHSAPTTSNDLVAAMRALDNRLNRSTRGDERGAEPASSRTPPALQPAFGAGVLPGLQPVPEEVAAVEYSEDAAARYVQRATGNERLAVAGVNVQDKLLRSTWMTRGRPSGL